ncbi:PREDICTED: uncharacterized protein LOC104821849 [Tarenaya hassleriana]|uniref:uncharacterized protein LOC104821849 n=1 Tax=Tarenaya hassleriana TaxID=28532 RepID=UPI00053C65B7|nr:PREDICTED: uncharacterized protein LOC104821849 [Tarenaya hassleriana]
MNGAMPEDGGSTAQKRLSMSFIVSLMALCARHAKKIKLRTRNPRRTHLEDHLKSPRFGISGGKYGGGGESNGWCTPPRSPFRARPKELFTSLSNKAMTMVRRKNHGKGGGAASEKSYAAAEEEEEEMEYGVWQRAILMGDKCQPLDFSGVIYYDCNGRQVKELPPRSPRGSPLLHYQNRSFVGSPSVTN